LLLHAYVKLLFSGFEVAWFLGLLVGSHLLLRFPPQYPLLIYIFDVPRS
jgi:hypothetical protein